MLLAILSDSPQESVQEGLSEHVTVSCLPEPWYLGQLAGVAGMAHLELLRRQLRSCCGSCRGQVQQPFLPRSTDRIWQSVNFTSAASYQVPTASREQGPCFSFLWLRHTVPQTWWLKTTGKYSAEVLQARSLKSKCIYMLLEALGESFPLSLLFFIPAVGIPWLVAYSCITPVSASVVVSPSPLLSVKSPLCISYRDVWHQL